MVAATLADGKRIMVQVEYLSSGSSQPTTRQCRPKSGLPSALVAGQPGGRAYMAVSPARRVGKPDDAAEAILFLASATFVTGTVLECTGGSNLTAAAFAR